MKTVTGPLARAGALVFHRDIKGNSNGFKVKPGDAYSTVLGNGTINVKNYLGLQGAAPAGIPGTAADP